eukprot:TRINITY_DN1680_c0_g1_i1.p1 TRINITY_DN1680_c0_g1~~TRINITY_DN1680_c0_g1_i1.p1  ORF type:complete len:201 (+),score=44.19 TRINITY_DN1680_c0_g1_i1:56-658(+)
MATTFHQLTVLGEGGVGKTALTVQFISNHFVEYYDPTIESSYRQQYLVDERVAFFEVLDTAGQEEYWTALASQWIRFGQGFLLLYSITSRHSFDEVPRLRSQIMMVKDCDDSDAPPMVLVGTKADLADDREVPTQEAEQLAKSWGIDFCETSARTRLNVTEPFFQVVRKIRCDSPSSLNKDDKVSKRHSKTRGKRSCVLF